MTSWWRPATIYQVYPRSFQDDDGDGVGDLAGMRRRLPYLADLGVDAVWLSPIFPSPMADFGYDVADYCGVDPLFGTMADFDALLADAHGLGLRLLLDFVPNHTSERHPWFAESRSARTSAKRDWYIWRDPAPGGGPPNNWISEFGGPAWTFDPATGQYYLHSFLPEQPDLNWRNPEVRRAMAEVLRFWLDKGVDGFRIDVLWRVIKDAQLRDNPPNPDWRPGEPEFRSLREVYSADRPDVHEVVAELRALADRYGDRLLIGEIYLPLERLVAYYGGGRGVQLPFNFQLLHTPWRSGDVADLVDRYESLLPEGAWPNWVLSNHDRPRIAARVGEAQARVAAMLLLTLRGTPTLYYGDEIGLAAVDIPPDRVRDPWALREPGASANRDASRTPMQWSSAPFAGFSTVEPWLPLSDDWAVRNVETQRASEGSMLQLHRRLLALRRAEPALQLGGYRRLASTAQVFVYERFDERRRFGVFLNFTSRPASVAASGYAGGEALLSTVGQGDPGRLDETLTLRPNEGLIVRAC